MNVSLNELQSVCRKAFLGMGFAAGHADDAAAMVTWLQSHGLQGLSVLTENMACVTAATSRQRPQIVFEDDGLAVVDGQNLSVLASGNLAMELAYTKASKQGFAVVRMQQCRQRQLIIGYLSRLAGRGINLTACWRHSQSPLLEQVVNFRAGSTVPSITVTTVSEPVSVDATHDDLTVFMAKHVELMPETTVRGQQALQHCHDEAELMSARQAALQQGMTVSPEIWDQLKAYAALTLVEASEASRTGAGPSE